MNRHLSTVAPQDRLLAPQLDYILLDGSGSMGDKWGETLQGLQIFCNCLVAENIHSHAILHVFDGTDAEWLQRDSLLSDWEALPGRVDLPGGGTPLFDAVNLMARRLADLDPPRCRIVIVTDGGENGSRATDGDEARALLDWCRAKGWQVTFLGADFSNSAQAKQLGADHRNSISVQRARLVEAGKLLAEKSIRNAQSGADINFSDEEKSDFGGYLAGPLRDPNAGPVTKL